MSLKTLRTIIDDDAERRMRTDDMLRIQTANFQKLLASSLAETEGIIYSQMGIASDADYVSLSDAKKILAKLHGGQSELSKIEFSNYLEKLNLLPKNPFTDELKSFFSTLSKVENPGTILEEFIANREKTVGAGPSLLPDDFYVSRADSGLSSDFYLRRNDYINIRDYFLGNKETFDLSPFQKDLMDSLRLDSDALETTYPGRRNFNKMHELRIQLRAELKEDKVFSFSEMNRFIGMEGGFEPGFVREEFVKTTIPSGAREKMDVESAKALFEKLVGLEGEAGAKGNIAIGGDGEVFIKTSFLRGAGLKSFFSHQLDNLKFAPIVMPIMDLIARADLATANYIQIGLGIMDLLLAADPVGLVMGLFGTVLGEWGIQDKRKYDNEHPEKYRGRHLGRVYVKGKWVPAIVKDVTSSEAFGSRDKTLVMEYGDDIMWVMDNTGDVTPVFTNRHEKRFTISDYEWEDAYRSSKTYVDRFDPLRGWYFLSSEEQKDVIKSTKEGTGGFGEEELKLDTPWLRSLESWRKVLELQKENKFKPLVDAAGGSIEFFTEDASFRGLRNIGYSNRMSVWPRDGLYIDKGTGDASGFWRHSSFYNALMDDLPYLDLVHPHIYDKDVYHSNTLTDDALFKSFQDKTFYDSGFENKYLLEHLFFDSFRALVYTQRLAAENEKYDEKITEERKYDTEDGFWTYHLPDEAKGIVQTPASSYYLDFAKDLPVAKSGTELQKQLDTITGYEDRNNIQKSYLYQKAINRFWLNEISKRNGLPELLEFTNRKSAEHAATSGIFTSSVGGGHATWNLDTPKPFLNDFSDDSHIYPWLNSGEGFLPDDMSFETVSAKLEEFDSDVKKDVSSLFRGTGFGPPEKKAPEKPKEKAPEKSTSRLRVHFDDDTGDISHFSVDGKDVSIIEMMDAVKEDSTPEPERVKAHYGDDGTLSHFTVDDAPFSIEDMRTTLKEEFDVPMEVREYLEEEHGLTIHSKADIPDYIAKGPSGKVDLYGIQSKTDPHLRSIVDSAGKTQTTWAPEIIHKVP